MEQLLKLTDMGKLVKSNEVCLKRVEIKKIGFVQVTLQLPSIK